MNRTDLSIRAFVEEDTDILLEIWEAANALAHPFLESAFVDQVRKDMREVYLPNAETWVAEVEGKPLGFIALIGAEIGGLFVHPSGHRRGIGQVLVDHARVLKGPLTVSVFERNSIGRGFYARAGFTFQREEMFEPAGDMLHHLAQPS